MKFLGIFIILTVLGITCHVKGESLADLYKYWNNYKKDYTVEEILSLFLNGTQFGTLFNKTDDTPIEQDVTFWCLNNKTKTIVQAFLNDSDIKSKLNLSKPVAFITHGWTDSVNKTWVQNTMKDYIQLVDTNVCGVDWSRFSHFNYFIAARENAFKVGAYLAKFIEYLNRLGVKYDNVTLVGHSLGGQISGIAGGILKGQVGQIFALDPAGPLYTQPKDVGESSRLDKSDAKYVQVIYTTRYMLGVGEEVGHQNFKPHIGIVPQSACFTQHLTDRISPSSLRCSHSIATEYFRYSLNPANIFNAVKCSNALSYLTNLCSAKTFDRMGIYAKREEGDFYLITSSQPPYV